MSLLLDTDVLSALARPTENAQVIEFLSQYEPADLFISVISLGELAKGWHLLSDGRRKQALGEWISQTERQYTDRLLNVTEEVAHGWGEMTARSQRQGIVIPILDGLIAATALHHGFSVVTRNSRHFRASGVPVIDPWEGC